MGVFSLSGIRALVEIYRFNQRKNRSRMDQENERHVKNSGVQIWFGEVMKVQIFFASCSRKG